MVGLKMGLSTMLLGGFEVTFYLVTFHLDLVLTWLHLKVYEMLSLSERLWANHVILLLSCHFCDFS